MKEEEIFGILIKDIRKNKSISQERLAEKTGLDRSFISLIERGKRVPTLTSIRKLAKALDMKASEILKLYEEKIDEICDENST